MPKLPGRRSKSPLLSEAQREQESKFGRCPKGHALPHRTNKGNCTPLFCAGSTPGNNTARKVKKEAKALATTDVGAISPVDMDSQEMDETASRISKAATRFRARLNFTRTPESFLDAKEREKWVEDKKQELVPLALADIEYSLKLGDAQEREKARREVLDMTGHGKRETGGGSTSPLIILAGVTGNLADNPWVRRVDKDGKELPSNVQVVNVSEK